MLRTTRNKSGIIAILALVVGVFATVVPARADGWPVHWRWSQLNQPCNGDCSFALFGGRLVENSMTSLFGYDGLDGIRAPWDWTYGDGGLIAANASRRFMSIGPWVDFEAEVGIGQRFGNMHETELWAAVFARWVAFPWNHWLRTTVAVSTGVNWATGVSEWERQRNKGDGGSQLLHYLAPEITFALPERPNLELLFRFHHRSGAKDILGPISIFNGVNGGAHYGTVGVRLRY